MPSKSPRVLDMPRGLIARNSRRPLLLLQHLGSGGCGSVHRARYIREPYATGIVAVKALKKAKPHSRADAMQYREVMNHKAVASHPNIITFRDHIPNQPDYLYIVMDFCPGGTLFNLIATTHALARNDPLVKSLFLQLMSAVDFCHGHNIFHRDLKPENVLINAERTQVYLADFGLSTNCEQSMTFKLGTKHYMTQECINKDGLAPSYNTRRSDIWALGIILLNMVSGRRPWNEATFQDPCFAAYVRKRSFLRKQLPISTTLNEILLKVLTPNPSMSISLRTFYKLVKGVDTFFMTENELQNAPRAVQSSAAYLQYRLPKPAEKPRQVQPPPDWPQSSNQNVSSEDSDSATNTDADWEDSVPGARMRRVIPFITDPDLHEGQVAWRAEKRAAALLERPEIAKPSPSAPAVLPPPPSVKCISPPDERLPKSSGANTPLSPPSSSSSSSSSSAHDTTSLMSRSDTSRIFRTVSHEIVEPSSSRPWMRLAVRMRRIMGRMV